MSTNAPTAETVSRPIPDVWRRTLAACAVAMVGIVALYFETFRSIVQIWGRSGTFAHGYLIVPISLYLIWEERAHIARLVPAPDVRALVPLAVASAGWMVSRLAGVLVLEQYFAVGTLAIGVWAVAGANVGRAIRFPLAFLLLGVPIGEALIPPLIDFTGAFTMVGLRLVGVAAIQTGNIIELSTGTWEVVEACSGLRYLIASVTIGILFAHLTFRSWRRKVLFVILSAIVPVFANGLRAFGIVMIGHLSDMRYAIGIDHLIYGWVFFGIVIFLLLWAGSLFRDDAEASEENDSDGETTRASKQNFFVAAALVIVVAALAPQWSAYAASRASEDLSSGLELALPRSRRRVGVDACEIRLAAAFCGCAARTGAVLRACGRVGVASRGVLRRAKTGRGARDVDERPRGTRTRALQVERTIGTDGERWRGAVRGHRRAFSVAGPAPSGVELLLDRRQLDDEPLPRESSGSAVQVDGTAAWCRGGDRAYAVSAGSGRIPRGARKLHHVLVAGHR